MTARHISTSPSSSARRTLAIAFRAAASGAFLASCSPTASVDYLRRFVFWSPSGVQDWNRFPFRPVARPDAPFRFAEDPVASAEAAALLREITYLHDGAPRTVDLDATLVATGTTAFIVIQDGKVVRESYLNGFGRDSMFRAFSISKSLTSALVGAAIDQGRIRDLDAPFVEYLPELRGRGYDGITVRHLLLMTGGLRFSYGRFPWKDSPLLYWNPDIRRVILAGPPLIGPPGERFNYSDYSSAILGMVLERATGDTLASQLERNLWKRIGAEYDATWSIDHEGTGLEYAASGFNARAIDLVKLGVLYLDGGRWGGDQVLPRAWVEESVRPLPVEPPGHSEQEVRERTFYKFGWWGHRLDGDRTAFFAHGYQGQLVYVCPDRRLVIARFGSEMGSVGRAWPMLLQAIAERFPVR